ncbi:Hydrolase, alpha/beta hydrolase fold family [Alloactinosynnema sp. L-07]|uniref:alpha/beta fold hydrolase n=1 Tax=Alloactinosynnema sp. L-07 TaxID=1653480 RepID=UPI00065F02DF|nr:alpha/beta fold hydrolase [Alloactinosynnema sp. L-07]CRK57197.1 Hydrolase, alpha/beta hydrolase fold family [Alloactinosynnema sp. L-07]
MLTEFDLKLDDGRVLHAYDTGGDDRLAVFWHHGTPNIGTPPAPLFPAAERLGIRWVSFDRPGYGGSTELRGRDIASAAQCAAAIADELGIGRFAVMGHSGGGPHALACAGMLPERVLSVVSVAGLAPFGAAGLDWYAGMVPTGVDSLRAAEQGPAVKEAYETSGAGYDPEFTEADTAALTGEWSWLREVLRPALAAGPGGLIADDIAYVTPWGFDPTRVTAPILLSHGGKDRVVPASHSRWLADHCPIAELRFSPQDGHLSILTDAESALEWIRSRA